MHKINFYGSVTVGTKGQIVIPADARETLKISSGDKLIVFGVPERNMLGVCPVEGVEAMLGEMTKKIKAIRNAVDSSKKG